MKNLITTISLSLFFFINLQDQNHSCSPKNERAGRSLKWFLELEQSNFKVIRDSVGLTGASSEELRPISNENHCKRIFEISESKNDWGVDFEKRDKYIYRTDDFFFIIYSNKKLGTGYTPLIIFDKDYKFLGKFSI